MIRLKQFLLLILIFQFASLHSSAFPLYLPTVNYVATHPQSGGGSCAASTTIYTVAGSYTYQVPNGCTSISIYVWGGGGGGGGDGGGSPTDGAAGTASSVNSTIIANAGAGGASGTAGTGGSGGTASGGDTNTSGVTGSSGISGASGSGGAGASGAIGGSSVASGAGLSGNSPGGGGSGAVSGGGLTGGGGGGGAYAMKTLTVTSLQNIAVVVGAGGAGGTGNASGGAGGAGKVVIATSGSTLIGDCTNASGTISCTGNAVYIGSFNSSQYMTTPGNCTDSATPTCDGSTDTLIKKWAANDGRSPTAYNVSTGTLSYTTGSANSSLLATNYADTDAAKYCENLVYAGYSDWFLPANDELSLFFYSRVTTSGLRRDTSSIYVSSTESSSLDQVFGKDFSNFFYGYSFPRSNNYYVRCVRKF